MKPGIITVLGKDLKDDPNYIKALEHTVKQFNKYLVEHTLVIDWEREVENRNQILQRIYLEQGFDKFNGTPEERFIALEAAIDIELGMQLDDFNNFIDISYTRGAQNGGGLRYHFYNTHWYGNMTVKPGITNYKIARGLMMHEFGHALGLDHVPKLFNFNYLTQPKKYKIQKRSLPIMSTGISESPVLTATDLNELFKYYKMPQNFSEKIIYLPENQDFYEKIPKLKLRKLGLKKAIKRARKAIKVPRPDDGVIKIYTED